jgi:hypothetical protein
MEEPSHGIGKEVVEDGFLIEMKPEGPPGDYDVEIVRDKLRRIYTVCEYQRSG